MEQTSGTSVRVRTRLSATYAMPGYLLGIYALFMLALGWFAHQRWGERSPAIIAAHAAPSPAVMSTMSPSSPPVPAEKKPMPKTTGIAPDASTPRVASAAATPPPPLPTESKTPRVIDGQVPPLTYSAHVFTTDPDKRSITLNGVRYREGESPMEGLLIEQIQQEVTLFDVNGEVFILDALADWPGGDIREAAN